MNAVAEMIDITKMHEFGLEAAGYEFRVVLTEYEDGIYMMDAHTRSAYEPCFYDIEFTSGAPTFLDIEEELESLLQALWEMNEESKVNRYWGV